MKPFMNNKKSDSLDSIYFQDYLKEDKKHRIDFKEVGLFLLSLIVVIGLVLAIYSFFTTRDKNNNSFYNHESASYNENDLTPPSYTLIISQDSVILNLDEDETSTIDISADNSEKSFKLNCDYSDIISVEKVSGNDRVITHKLIPQSIGTGYIEYMLIDADDESIIYDTKRISITVEGTLSTGTFNNHFYQVFDDSMTWTEAKMACEEAGGHLATISSNEEQDYIQHLIKSTRKENIWIGGVYSVSSGSWSWVDNSEWNYTNWDVSQPDNYTNDEYFLRMKNRDRIYDDWEAYDGNWNDTDDGADGTSDNSDAPIASFGYICEWDYIETSIIGNLQPTNDVGYNPPGEIIDCFGNNYNAEQAFSITFSGRNECRAEFHFEGIDYRTINYDVSIADSSRDKFVNAEDYSFNSDFSLCDMTLVAIQADGSETHCSGTWDILNYGFFNELSVIHHTVALPEGTVAVRFEGNAWQSYAGVKVIIANATLTTETIE